MYLIRDLDRLDIGPSPAGLKLGFLKNKIGRKRGISWHFSKIFGKLQGYGKQKFKRIEWLAMGLGPKVFELGVKTL